MTYAETFEAHRRHLFRVAYHMLGTVSDAEDVVQDAFLRWQRADHATITTPRAYLTTAVTRLAIDRLRHLHARREAYVGPWLPEPLVQPLDTNPTELADTVSLALLVVLETLGPIERAVFLLRTVFEYDYPAIADIVERSTANCRKIFQRARQHVDAGEARYTPTPAHHQAVTQHFMAAMQSGELGKLMAVLTDDCVLQSDGGGKVSAARVPIVGANKVARFLLGIMRKAPPSFQPHRCRVNGTPGLVMTIGGAIDSVMTWTVQDERVAAVQILRNPEKLAHVHFVRTS